VSTAVARTATTADHDWMSAYVEHCHRLSCSDRALRDRLRSAREFLAAHPDPGVWMDQPTTTRVTELRRTRTWPLLVFRLQPASPVVGRPNLGRGAGGAAARLRRR